MLRKTLKKDTAARTCLKNNNNNNNNIAFFPKQVGVGLKNNVAKKIITLNLSCNKHIYGENKQ